MTISGLKDGEEKTEVLGTLCASMNEFSAAGFDHVFDVTVSWDGMAPAIHEIFLSGTKPAAADKAALEALVAEAEAFGTDTLTPASAAALQQALQTAKTVAATASTTQTMVDSAAAALRQAMDHAVVSADRNAFRTALDAVEAGVLPEENYLARTWKGYAAALNAARQAAEDENISQAELDALLETVQSAAASLVYEVASIENLKVLVEDAAVLKEEDWTAQSFAALQSALDAARAVVAADEETRQAPSVVKEAAAALQTALDGLREAGSETPDRSERQQVSAEPGHRLCRSAESRSGIRTCQRHREELL